MQKSAFVTEITSESGLDKNNLIPISIIKKRKRYKITSRKRTII